MKIQCPKCQAIMKVDESKIPEKGVHGRCPKRQERFLVRREDGFHESPPKVDKMVCPHCQQEINPGDVQCPKCGAVYEKYSHGQVPSKTQATSGELEDTKPKKKCPFCGEEILAVAKKCKHCREDLTEPNKIAKESTSNENIGYIMLIIPLISTLLIWFWIGSMNLLQSPGSTLTFLGIATIVITAILGAYEAQKLGFGKPNKTGKVKKESGPIGYFLGMILLWIVVYPLYLYQRSKKGKKNLVVGGILIAIVFGLSWYSVGSAIDTKVDEIGHIVNKLSTNQPASSPPQKGSVEEIYNKTARATLKNAAIVQYAYAVDKGGVFCKSIEPLISKYELYVPDGVTISIKQADAENFVMEAYHQKGNETYIVTSDSENSEPIMKE